MPQNTGLDIVRIVESRKCDLAVYTYSVGMAIPCHTTYRDHGFIAASVSTFDAACGFLSLSFLVTSFPPCTFRVS
jgi:hypothetical protein